jgi:hypothetical protein
VGDVGSDTTFRRMVADLAETPGATNAVGGVMRQARTRVWAEHGWSDPGRRVILDIDATLTPVHSEKEDAKGNYKRGFGFHPVRVVSLTAPARPSPLSTGLATAGANTDRRSWLGSSDDGLDALPESVRPVTSPRRRPNRSGQRDPGSFRLGRSHPRIPQSFTWAGLW